MSNLEKKEQFIKRNISEVEPVLRVNGELTPEDKQTLAAIDTGTAKENDVDGILERFETKVFVYEKPEVVNGKNVLVTFSDPGPYGAVLPLIEQMENDARIKTIAVIEHGVKSSEFARRVEGKYQNERNEDKPVMQDIADIIEQFPPEIIFATRSSQNGPENVFLSFFEGKSIFNAKRVYLIADGWQSGQVPISLKDVDGIFCNDELSKKMTHRMMPDFPESKIFSTGTPQLDGLQIEKAQEYEAQGRDKLHIPQNALVCQYSGGIQSQSAVEYGIDPNNEMDTFAGTVATLVEVAKDRPDDEFVLLVRPHPRDPDKETIYRTQNSELPSNLRVILDETLDSNEASYASDITIGLVPAEVFLAPLRGKRGAFVDFGNREGSKKMLDGVYGEAIAEEIRNSGGRDVIDSPEQLKELLMHIHHGNLPNAPLPSYKVSERILDEVLKDV